METQNQQSYVIKTGVFEGPFGLLLNLVEEKKLFINDVSLAAVTEDYLNYVKKLGGFNPVEMSSFMVVAATLILIKSKSLLPGLNLTEEEEGDIKNLEERLRLYEQFNRLSIFIKNNFGTEIIFPPLERKNDILVFLPDGRITKNQMMAFAGEVLGRIPKKTFLPEVEVKKVISIEEMLDRLVGRIKDTIKMTFKEFTGASSGGKAEKVEVIVGFLAMLELVRQGIINAAQEGNGRDIIIEKHRAE